MREGRLGSVHSWELVTAVDGPGTRLTTFLSGCPLQCLYCHNPDTLAMKDGKPVTSDELLARIARYTGVFRATGGGITLSGGEVLMQPAFAARIREWLKTLRKKAVAVVFATQSLSDIADSSIAPALIESIEREFAIIGILFRAERQRYG